MNEQRAMDAAHAEAAKPGSTIESISAAAGVPLDRLRDQLAEMLSRSGSGGVAVFVPRDLSDSLRVNACGSLSKAELKIVAARVEYATECFVEHVRSILAPDGVTPARLRRDLDAMLEVLRAGGGVINATGVPARRREENRNQARSHRAKRRGGEGVGGGG